MPNIGTMRFCVVSAAVSYVVVDQGRDSQPRVRAVLAMRTAAIPASHRSIRPWNRPWGKTTRATVPIPKTTGTHTHDATLKATAARRSRSAGARGMPAWMSLFENPDTARPTPAPSVCSDPKRAIHTKAHTARLRGRDRTPTRATAPKMSVPTTLWTIQSSTKSAASPVTR